ncbi:Y-family DNA polymerase [Aurantiacibacter gangjinensis]|uniref:Y-family DNA polymerase n=1 Tax=Aurantiacibacter gangjinensis TaxID=502682 RepID=UPI000909C991|nr:DNA polymerase Y family protein [Aurantiacibacter gangjinensis]APE29430.1 DNA polymerase-like protein [Aurantiacibacter gangjinensis]
MLAREGAHGPVIHDLGKAALALGLKRGARVTDMRALVPDLRVEDAEEAADTADLAMLARWVRRWCPWSQVDGMDGLLLDTTGSEHLHGGEAAMLEEMRARFAALGLTAQIAAAPTIGAAWALARYGDAAPTICPADAIQPMLDPLPVAALRLDADTVLLLRRLGLKTVGALAAMPREALVRRFRKIEALSANPVMRLDQATGRQKELLVSPEIRRPLRALRRLAEPLGDLAGLEQVLGDLADDLVQVLEAKGRGARILRFTAYRVDGQAYHAEARTSRASRDPADLVPLFDGKLDTIDPGFGIEAACLEATDSEDLDAQQADLTGKARSDVAFARMIDRLIARLGPRHVLQPIRQGSHMPERGERLVPYSPDTAAAPRAVHRRVAGPLRLLDRPEIAEVVHAVPDGPPARFRWRRKLHDIARSAGPERIAPEWWREKSSARLRDYYHVEDSEGCRFWLYREGVAGDGRGDTTRWYVHGLDA